MPIICCVPNSLVLSDSSPITSEEGDDSSYEVRQDHPSCPVDVVLYMVFKVIYVPQKTPTVLPTVIRYSNGTTDRFKRVTIGQTLHPAMTLGQKSCKEMAISFPNVICHCAPYLLNIHCNLGQAFALKYPNQKDEQDCVDRGTYALIKEEFGASVENRKSFGFRFMGFLPFGCARFRGESVLEKYLV
jgi:hypothetical protein